MELLLSSAGFAFALTLLGTPLLGRALLRLRVLDQPNDAHKTHPRPVPTLGGAAVAAAVVVALLWPGRAPAWGPVVYAACGAVFLVGALDDVLHLSPWHKLAAELLCATAVCAAGVVLPGASMALAAPLTVLWLAACANGFNLTDGADGVAALTGAIAAAGLGLIAFSAGMVAMATLLAALAAALAGFLIFNFPAASIFMGDSGALPIGFVLGVCGIAWSTQAQDAAAAAAPVFALALPLGETLLSAVRRSLRGDPIFRADRRHIHHRLAARGMSPREVALWCGAYSLLGAATAAVVAANGAAAVSALAAAAFAVTTFGALRYLRYAELSCAAEMLLNLRGPWPLSQQIRVAELRNSLELASDPDQRWERLVEGMSELGFRDVRLLDRAGEPLRQSSRALRAAPVWKLTVDLPDGEGTLEAQRIPEPGRDALVSDALVDTLRGAFADEAPAPRPIAADRQAGDSHAS